MVKKSSNFKTAKLYAKAFYESVEGSGMLAEALKDAEILRSAKLNQLAESKYLSSPIIDFEQKMILLEAVLQKLELNEKTANLLKIMAQSNNFGLLDLVIDDFFAIYNNKHNVAEITVETSEKLNIEQDTLLREKLSKIFNKKIKIIYMIKAEILGGLVIKNGTMLIDLSLRNKLKNLEQLMKGTD